MKEMIMDDTSHTILLVLFIGLAVAISVGFVLAYEHTAEAGKVTFYMSKDLVLKAWGEPTEVKFVGFGGFQREVWIYRDPFRTVTFSQYGLVLDWVPKK
jgi:hypothetical protein